MKDASERDGWGIVLLVLGVGMIANGIWMLVDPGMWYQDLPAGVPDYGPLNIHFVRDIGCAFITVGVALVWGARRPAVRLPLTVMATLFLVAHAVLHIHDTARGIVDSDHWWLDLPGVYAPALVLIVACFQIWRHDSIQEEKRK
jgi:hypothetical protein